jgi:hypothetical protein
MKGGVGWGGVGGVYWRKTCEAFEADGVTFLSSKYLTKLLQKTNIYIHFVTKEDHGHI